MFDSQEHVDGLGKSNRLSRMACWRQQQQQLCAAQHCSTTREKVRTSCGAKAPRLAMTAAIWASASMGTVRTTLKADASSISCIRPPWLVVPSTSSFRPSGGTCAHRLRVVKERSDVEFWGDRGQPGSGVKTHGISDCHMHNVVMSASAASTGFSTCP